MCFAFWMHLKNGLDHQSNSTVAASCVFVCASASVFVGGNLALGYVKTAQRPSVGRCLHTTRFASELDEPSSLKGKEKEKHSSTAVSINRLLKHLNSCHCDVVNG